MIAYLKREKPGVPVAVLTNGTMFSDPEVRQSLLQADLVLPSLDAATEAVLKDKQTGRFVGSVALH